MPAEQLLGFREWWSPAALVGTAAVAVLYALIVGPFRSMFPDAKPVSHWRRAAFLAGLAVHYLARGGPVDLLGHFTFSAHMVAMFMAYYLAPPLMLLGCPEWLVRPLFSRPVLRRVFGVLTAPLVTAVLFNAAFSLYHFPAIHDYVMTHYTLHWWYWTGMLAAAFLMWWPILGPMRDGMRLSHLRKIAYLLLNSVLITPACALIIFAGEPLYATYTDATAWAKALGYCVPAETARALAESGGPLRWAWFSPLEDQQLGGVLMKVLQEFVFGAVLGYLFFSWYREERKKDAEEDAATPGLDAAGRPGEVRP